MSMTATERLAAAIEYPDPVPEGAVAFSFRTDGREVEVSESPDGRILLRQQLSSDEALLPSLTEFVPGRMLREEAVLAADDAGAFLWQDAPAAADARTLRRLFETFMDSCDWWRARVEERTGHGAETGARDMPGFIIRP
jgi:hypothetical protein